MRLAHFRGEDAHTFTVAFFFFLYPVLRF